MEVFRNRSAWIFWIFCMWFACGSAALTYIVIRHGPPEGTSWSVMWGLCALFWLATAALGYAAMRAPSVVAVVAADGALSITLRRGLRRERKVFSAASVHGAKLVVSEDTEGLPYHLAQVTAGEHFKVTIAEGTRHKCEHACERFNTAYASVRRQHSGPNI